MVLVSQLFVIMRHGSLQHSVDLLACTSVVLSDTMVWSQEPDLPKQAAQAATKSSPQVATGGSQQPQQQPPAAGNPKEGSNTAYSLFGDQNAGGNSASWPSIPSSKSTHDAADR